MTTPKRNQRWWLWVPLLAGAAWLALFGDKAPNGAASVSVSTPRPGAPLERPSTPATSGSRTVLKSTRPDNIPSRPVVSATSQAPGGLESVIPRDQLILKTTAKSNEGRDLFASGGWNPPVPVVKPLPPPPPTAPALPFTFLGKKLESGAWEVFLARGDQSFVVRAGTLIENTYRVEAITPPTLSLTYLPLAEKQTLAIGDSP